MADQLSPRETEALGLAARGWLNKEIAAEMGVSLNTIGSHFANIRVKLGATDKANAVAIAITRGLITFEEEEPDSE